MAGIFDIINNALTGKTPKERPQAQNSDGEGVAKVTRDVGETVKEKRKRERIARERAARRKLMGLDK